MKILIADDDRTTRTALQGLLSKWGYEVVSVHDGNEAWAVLQAPDAPNLAILDWMMPGIEGPSLCRSIRKSGLGSYVYVILLTAKTGKGELLEGLEAGADDFISKPFNAGELKARLKAADRILALEKSLKIKNRELHESNLSLSRSNEIIIKDLEVAATVQQSLLPSHSENINGFYFDSLFMPCDIIGGDMFNFIRLGENHLAFYILDISGHGVPAAMLSVTVSKTLTSLLYEETMKSGIKDMISPADMVTKLNRLFQTNDALCAYFTIILGILDSRTGRALITQAGHPHPIHMSCKGASKKLGNGGFPVGLLEDATYTQNEFTLSSGDRLFLYSDGITEATNKDEKQFSSERLIRIFEENRSFCLDKLMQKVREELFGFREGELFSDDISLMVLERDFPSCQEPV